MQSTLKLFLTFIFIVPPLLAQEVRIKHSNPKSLRFTSEVQLKNFPKKKVMIPSAKKRDAYFAAKGITTPENLGQLERDILFIDFQLMPEKELKNKYPFLMGHRK